MDAQQLEACLAEVAEIVFEPSFDRAHAPHALGLVFGRMTRSVKELIARMRDTCFREHMLLYLRPLGEDGIGISLIIREAHLIANSAPLLYDGQQFGRFTDGLHRNERRILAAYQRDRNGALRLVTDAQMDPFFAPVHYFRSSAVLVEH